MSDEDPQPQPHPFIQMFGPPKPPTPQEQLEYRKAIQNFAKATLPSLKAMQRSARDLNTLYMDAPVRLDDVARRNGIVRENIAVMLEMMEGLAEL